MRKRTRLLLALAVVLVATGVTGVWKALATVPNPGTPVQLSTYGTVTVGTTFTLSITTTSFSVAIFSSQGPFYTEKVNVQGVYSPTFPTITLRFINYDDALSDFISCPTVMAHAPSPYVDYGFGDIMSVVPFPMIDQTGAAAVPASNVVTFGLTGSSCTALILGGLTLNIEATVLAPTSATVCITASESYPVPTCLVT